MAGTAHAVPARYCRDTEFLAACLVANAPVKPAPHEWGVVIIRASTDCNTALTHPQCHQASDGCIVADGSIGPDTAIAS